VSRHIVQWGGGVTSWATGRWVADRYGTADLVLLFADTLVEDEDLYRFNDDASADIGAPITRVADGRTPWQVFEDERFIGNSRIAPCSKLLKQEVCRRWLKQNADPGDTVLYVGIDWTETERLPGIQHGWAPWRIEAPLCEPPYMDKDDWKDACRLAGFEPPRLYSFGFPHNNCGGACVRGGQAQWKRLLEVFPDRFAANEAAEQRLRERLGTSATILRDRTGGTTKPLSLAELRRRVEAAPTQGDLLDSEDWGGCGCMTDLAAAA
jgi:hypothetical protein